MPKNLFQRMIFAFITVVITVHCYVFYSLYVINGSTFMQLTGETTVIGAINAMGGVSVFGTPVPIWAVILIEFALAYTLECVMGSPCSFKLVSRVFKPGSINPVLFETAIITATVGLMCPAMSLLAAIMYYPYSVSTFSIWTLLANWLKLICFNLPFAFFSQLLFIQPFVRTVFKAIFCRRPDKAAATPDGGATTSDETTARDDASAEREVAATDECAVISDETIAKR